MRQINKIKFLVEERGFWRFPKKNKNRKYSLKQPDFHSYIKGMKQNNTIKLILLKNKMGWDFVVSVSLENIKNIHKLTQKYQNIANFVALIPNFKSRFIIFELLSEN